MWIGELMMFWTNGRRIGKNSRITQAKVVKKERTASWAVGVMGAVSPWR